tara:strand:+ start:2659 stop:3060 length:402 start_codon:yes stop_codon:yes gene_type:complete
MKNMGKNILRSLEETECYKIRRKVTNELYGDYQSLLISRLFNEHESYVIKRNAFPYSWKEKDYKHDCLWINPVVDERWTEEMILDICVRYYRNNEIIYLFENEMDARSVLDIRHYHIIYKLDYSMCKKLKCKI